MRACVCVCVFLFPFLWLAVFHVTDQLGNKLADRTLILYIQQTICDTRRRGGIPKELQTCLKKEVRPCHVSTEYTALEITGRDRPGLMSEISAALYELGCHVTAAVQWTYNSHVACIIHIEDGLHGGSIMVQKRLAQVQEKLESVVEAHHESGEQRSVRLTAPAPGRTHTERRLHQLMYANRDYEQCQGCDGSCRHWNGCMKTHVTIETCREKGYSVVNMRSRDRSKLLFDTVCALTDMEYVVFHATVRSKGSMADQEYFIRRQDGCSLISQGERHKLTQCLIAATERRVPHGLRLDLCTENKMGLLSEVTRVFRENGLSITRAEIGIHGERATGSFYVTDASGHDVNPRTVELVRQEIGGSALVVSKSRSCRSSREEEERPPRFSLGNLLWSQLERLSGNFSLIKS
ncbi:hypothetical protein DITRI_Ditri18aG0078300 [Diplodiscus trichospermus]